MRKECGALRDFKTGTGFAGAKLSEILPTARVARFVRMTKYKSGRLGLGTYLIRRAVAWIRSIQKTSLGV
jgi:hypothetical protein